MNVGAAISVILPTFNRSAYIRESVESVLAQSVSPLEVLVVDDGSTDDTATVVQSIKGPVRYFRQKNQGSAASRNLGLQQARGEFIAFQDSDDIWTPGKLQMQCEFFSQHPDIDFVFGLMSNFEKPEDPYRPAIWDNACYEYLRQIGAPIPDMAARLLAYSFVPTPTVMCRRTAIERVGGFDEHFRIAQDFDYWLRSTCSCTWGFLNQILLRRRVHPGNIVNDYARRSEYHLQVLLKAETYLDALAPSARPVLRDSIQRVSYSLGSHYLNVRNHLPAYHTFRKQISRNLAPQRSYWFRYWLKLFLAFIQSRHSDSIELQRDKSLTPSWGQANVHHQVNEPDLNEKVHLNGR